MHEIAAAAEKNFIPNNNFNELIEKERNESWMYGGKTVLSEAERGDANPPKQKNKGVQLRLF